MNRGRNRRNDPVLRHLASRNGEDPDSDLWDQYDFVDISNDPDSVQIHYGDSEEMEVREPGPILRPEPVPERDLELEATYGPHNDAEYFLSSRFPYNEWEYDDNGEVVTRRPYEELIALNQQSAWGIPVDCTDKEKERVVGFLLGEGLQRE